MAGEYWSAPVWSSRRNSATPLSSYFYPDSENVGLATGKLTYLLLEYYWAIFTNYCITGKGIIPHRLTLSPANST